MGTLGGFAPPFGPPTSTPTPLAALGLAKPSRALAPGLASAAAAASPWAKPAFANAVMIVSPTVSGTKLVAGALWRLVSQGLAVGGTVGASDSR